MITIGGKRHFDPAAAGRAADSHGLAAAAEAIAGT
jgi:hypothetical protein